jgi:hypothetical protein
MTPRFATHRRPPGACSLWLVALLLLPGCAENRTKADGDRDLADPSGDRVASDTPPPGGRVDGGTPPDGRVDGGLPPVGCGAEPTERLILPSLELPLAGGPRAAPVTLPAPPSGPQVAVALPALRLGSPLGEAEPPRRFDLRLLLVTARGTEQAYLSSRAALDRLGVPYDVLVAADEPLEPDLLRDDDGACLYRGVILSGATLSMWDEAAQQWVSALSPVEWQTLATYQHACDAREVVWYAFPTSALGLTSHSHFESSEGETGVLTAAGAALFGLRADVEIPIRRVWGYRATPLAGADVTPLLETPDGHVLAALHRRADGREVLALTADSTPWSLHTQVLAHGVIDWVSRGVFLGDRRVYLAAQVDDVFLKSLLWVPGEGSSGAVFRITGDDVEALVTWQDWTRARLPAGSTFTTQLAFNGFGTTHSDTTPVDALLLYEHEFDWINHTWGHPNMDAMSSDLVELEIEANCDLAAAYGLGRFSCAEAVTPQISGLDNPDAVFGLLAAGVRAVVSDASISAAKNPGNPGSNPSHNTGRHNPLDPNLYQVPRHATNIYFNCSLPAELVDLYNERQRETLGYDSTYEQILEREGDVGLHYLLTYNANPLMFHQANLRVFTDATGAPRSLYTDWVDSVLDRYLDLVELPIFTLDIAETAALMQARAAYDACGVAATIVQTEAGSHLELVARDACVVPVTGVDAPGAGAVVHYGGVVTTSVALEPCVPVIVPL